MRRNVALALVCAALALTVVAAAVWLSALRGDPAEQREATLDSQGLTVTYPAGWDTTGYSTSNSPRRTAVASYALADDEVEGDCGGAAAVRRLPADGVIVIVIDYGLGLDFVPGREWSTRPSDVEGVPDGQFAEYECVGPSTMFQLHVGRRYVQVHVASGPAASEANVERALSVVRSLRENAGKT